MKISEYGFAPELGENNLIFSIITTTVILVGFVYVLGTVVSI